MGIRLEKPFRFKCYPPCDDCVVRFKCFTQRGVVHLDWEDLKKIQELSE